jgi:hypothetical protein
MERERLSPGAVRAFLNIMARWQVRDEDARLLLGGLSTWAYEDFKTSPDRPLDEDGLRRISCLAGIVKALNILYSEALADRWMRLPNRNPIFGGSTPLAHLISGGLPAFETVRRLLDARRGGR